MSCVSFGADESAGHAACEQKAIKKDICELFGSIVGICVCSCFHSRPACCRVYLCGQYTCGAEGLFP